MKKAVLCFLLFLIFSLAGLWIYFSSSSEVTANIDDYIYDLPFGEGEHFEVVQGYGGMFSHENKAALDFDMPEGTPVYAAREGIIYSFKDDSDAGGPFAKYEKKSNYIIIKHGDGSFGCYWHLRKNGVAIKKGIVSKGQLIGYSGSTGFVLQPHLHFTVKRKLNYEKDSFIRTKFRTSNGIRLLEKGDECKKPER